MYRKIRNQYHNKPNFYKFSTKPCTFKGYKCSQQCVENYYYCIRHILEDESAPFQQCSFVYPFSMKKCPFAAPKSESSDSYCPEHLSKLQRTRNRATGKTQPPLTSEKLLASLAHYVPPNPPKRRRFDSENEEIDVCDTSKPANPFVDVDTSAVNHSLSSILDFCSESDSDVDATIISRTARCNDEDSSDAESADSAGEDIFKFSTVFTEEEALIRAKEKTARLKALYNDQLKRLSHLLRERRRDYLQNIQKEKECNSSIHDQPRNTIREVILADKVKSYNNYRKHSGTAALLRKKLIDKRNQAVDNVPHRGPWGRCIFTEGGVKCSVRSIPSSKYCPKHILQDPAQILFRPCGFGNGDVCKEPLPGLEQCVFHMDTPPQQILYNTTLSSEDDEEEKVKGEVKTEENCLAEFPLDSVTPFNGDDLKLEKVEEEPVQNGMLDFMGVVGEDKVFYTEQHTVFDQQDMEGVICTDQQPGYDGHPAGLLDHQQITQTVEYCEEVILTDEVLPS